MSKSIKIGDRHVGDDHPPYVIAEACVNHQGNFEIAKRMVYFAHAMGADAIKFQMHILEDEMLPEVPMSDNFDDSLWDVIEKTNFSTDQHRQLIALSSSLGIQYLCTPFSRAAADVLNSLGVQAFKTGSGELTNTPFMRHIAAYGKPVIVSTGMSLMEEIQETVDIFKKAGTPLVLTHCVFSTQGRLNLIPDVSEICKYITGIARHKNVTLLAAGGTANHLQLLLAPPPTVTLSKVMQDLKGNSSRWMNQRGVKFAWQEGFGAFGVSQSKKEAVVRYIATQEEHHRKWTFEQEYLTLLRKSGVTIDKARVFG